VKDEAEGVEESDRFGRERERERERESSETFSYHGTSNESELYKRRDKLL
jgi:hypothetical protein